MKRTLPWLLLVVLFVSACRPVQPRAESAGATPAAAAAPLAEPGTSVRVDPAAPLPADPDLRVGKLENGLTYYIRKNSEPPDRAELWLAVNAGSALEDEDQRGLAHFLEHMMFNGTENYAGSQLIDFLESIGMRFGPDVNAYTSFDETVYTLQVPTDNAATLQKSLEILKEWAAKATISPEEVDKERGVIVEEWRMRDLNAQGRVTDSLVETLLNGSQYAERLPIGQMDVVRTAPAETLRRFYERWYRPDNLAVIAVGDFADLDEVEQWIKDEFGDLKNPDAPLDRTAFAVPDYAANNARVITDPEFPSTVLYVAYRQPAQVVTTTGDYRAQLIDALAANMINQRYQEITRKANAPFLYAGTGTSELVRPVQISTVVVQTEADKPMAGLEAALTEVERVLQHGFTASELDRAKTELLRQFKSTYDERNNIENRVHAQAYLDNFLTGATPTGAADDYQLAQELLPGITLDEVEAAAKALYPEQNRTVLLIAPAKEGVTLPTAEELAATLANATGQAVEPYAENVVTTPLLETPPVGSKIVAEETLPELGITHLTLGNGVQVYLKPTTFKDDQVILSSFSPGGTSVVTDTDVPEAGLAAQIVAQSGIGQLSRTDLEKLLAGKAVSVSPYVDDLGEGFRGNASPQDLETLFQLVYLYATQPRLDKDAFDTFQRQVQDYLQNRALSPDSALEDKYNEIFCGENVRCNTVALLKQVSALDLDRSLAIYQERFGDLDDSVFMLAGAFDVEQIKPWIETYLGALPSRPGSETWTNDRPKLPVGRIDATVNKGIDPRSSVEIVYSGEFTPTVKNRVALQMMNGVLDILVREDLREKRGGIYGAGIQSSIEALPTGQYQVQISFTAEPTRVNELVSAVFEQVHDLQDKGPSAQNFEKVQAQLARTQEENLQRNEAWISWMTRYLTGNEGPLDTILIINDVIAAMTPADVQAMAQAVLPDSDHVTLILHPENFTPQP